MMMMVVVLLPTQHVAAQEFTYDEKLDIIVAIEEALGHLQAAQKNNVNEEYFLAQLHLGHPLAETYGKVISISDDETINRTFELVFAILKNTKADMAPDEFNKEVIAMKRILYDVRDIVGGDLVDDPAFKMRIIKELLMASMNDHYKSEVTDGEESTMEFQDSYFFAWRAKILFGTMMLIDHEDQRKLYEDFDNLFMAYNEDASYDEIHSTHKKIVNDVNELIQRYQ